MSVLAVLPPRQRLELVLASLCRHLPGQLGVLLDDARFNDARNPLMRLADPRWAAEASAAMTAEEAAWMAEELWGCWSRIGHPTLEPLARLILPDEVWVHNKPVRVPIQLVVLGLDPGWRVQWTGSVIAGDPPILLVDPPRSGAQQSRIQVDVIGAIQGQQRQISLQTEVLLRCPHILFDDSRTCLAIRDQDGLPAGAVRVQIGDTEFEANHEGLLLTAVPFPAGARVWVAGIAMGRVPKTSGVLDEPTVEIPRPQR